MLLSIGGTSAMWAFCFSLSDANVPNLTELVVDVNVAVFVVPVFLSQSKLFVFDLRAPGAADGEAVVQNVLVENLKAPLESWIVGVMSTSIIVGAVRLVGLLNEVLEVGLLSGWRNVKLREVISIPANSLDHTYDGTGTNHVS